MATFAFDAIRDLSAFDFEQVTIGPVLWLDGSRTLSYPFTAMDRLGGTTYLTKYRNGVGFATPVPRRWDPDLEAWVPLTSG